MSDSSRIVLGRYDPWRRTPSLEIRKGIVKFIPGKATECEFAKTEAAYEPGTRIEYRVQMGDMLFEGDRGQAIERTLWVIAPSGTKKLLANGPILYISLPVAARNLHERGIPFNAVRFYKGAEGKDIESEISISRSRFLLPIGLILGLSNLWLGVVAALITSKLSYIVAIGLLGFAIPTTMRFRVGSRRTAILKSITSLPIYAAGYAATVVLVRFLVAKGR